MSHEGPKPESPIVEQLRLKSGMFYTERADGSVAFHDQSGQPVDMNSLSPEQTRDLVFEVKDIKDKTKKATEHLDKKRGEHEQKLAKKDAIAREEAERYRVTQALQRGIVNRVNNPSAHAAPDKRTILMDGSDPSTRITDQQKPNPTPFEQAKGWFKGLFSRK
jgi:hypothetical protein